VRGNEIKLKIMTKLIPKFSKSSWDLTKLGFAQNESERVLRSLSLVFSSRLLLYFQKFRNRIFRKADRIFLNLLEGYLVYFASFLHLTQEGSVFLGKRSEEKSS